jgi:drug/metabolite transporter (DMT)-like permease
MSFRKLTTQPGKSRRLQRERLSAYTFSFLTLTATFLMGSSFIAGRILLEQGVPATLLMGWRFFVAACCTLPFALVERTRDMTPLMPISFSDALKTLIIGLLQTTSVMGTLMLAMKFIPASTAAILQFSNPLWLAAISPLLLGQKLKRLSGIAVSLGLAGVMLTIAGGSAHVSSQQLIGAALALLSALCWVISTLARMRYTPRIGRWALAFWQMLLGSIAILGFGYLSGEKWPTGLDGRSWLWFAWLSVPASAGASGLCFIVLHSADTRRCSCFLFLAPLFTLFLSFLALDEAITVTQVVADLMVGAALWLLKLDVSANSSRHVEPVQ